ncbi:hypothetical protein FHS60_000727 [Alloprevotella rava]|uniref:Uncharacterized protein n=1 Tax=Alloprevotella rava TaxID=671218 RepID=A0A7W5UVE2_9BACT|nr:hypothetical protein [Alloprevotella rava]
MSHSQNEKVRILLTIIEIIIGVFSPQMFTKKAKRDEVIGRYGKVHFLFQRR